MDVDEVFLEESLAEAREGEAVTIMAPRRQWKAMRVTLERLGATEEEIARITFTEP